MNTQIEAFGVYSVSLVEEPKFAGNDTKPGKSGYSQPGDTPRQPGDKPIRPVERTNEEQNANDKPETEEQEIENSPNERQDRL